MRREVDAEGNLTMSGRAMPAFDAVKWLCLFSKRPEDLPVRSAGKFDCIARWL